MTDIELYDTIIAQKRSSRDLSNLKGHGEILLLGFGYLGMQKRSSRDLSPLS